MFGGNNESHITGDNNLVFQDIQGSTITVNLNDPKEIRNFLISFQDQLQKLPLDILNKLKEFQELETPPVIGANLYLTTLGIFAEGIYSNGYQRQGTKLAITVTNLTKEIRYFNKPYFKSNPRLFGASDEYDSFMFLDDKDYPFRLEYGEVKHLSFDLKPAALESFRGINVDGAYLEAFVGTTVGELYSSNKMNISHLF